jgi:hypothetical protein
MTRDAAHAIPIAALAPAPGAAEIEGPAPPWDTWDWASPGVQQRVLRFSPAEVARLKARGGGSRLDALFALVWGAIVRARNLDPDTTVSLGQCIGLRGRVEGVGDSHLGADLLITASELPASGAADLRTAARSIRSAIEMYTPAAVGAELHRMAYASDPVRRWNMFFGEHDTHTTSWLHTKLYELELGGVKPVWAQAAFPGLDGLVAALEDPSGGINIQLWLKEEIMARVVEDPAILNV